MLNIGAAGHSYHLPQTQRYINLIKKCAESIITYYCGWRRTWTIFRCIIDIQSRGRSTLY